MQVADKFRRQMTTRTLNILILTLGILFDLKSQTGDTINVTDANGKKQGHWIVTGKDKPGTCYKSDQKVQDGKYKDGQKTGVWTEYFCSGNIKNFMTFNDGRPEGPGKVFYENGKIQDEGVWKKNRWVSIIGSTPFYTDDTTFKFKFRPKDPRIGVKNSKFR